MEFILDRLRDKNPDGSLSIMFVVIAYPAFLCADVEVILIGILYTVCSLSMVRLLELAQPAWHR